MKHTTHTAHASRFLSGGPGVSQESVNRFVAEMRHALNPEAW